ncbi:MAG: hypothetical protein KDD04_07475, partial [Sinomicrobium sp.]|nr:hypothetical protein [Sinomicrobium sp.]
MMQTIFRVLLYVALGATAIDLPAQNYEITFHVDMTREKPAERVGIRGNTAPLSWEKTWYLTDEDQDGIYTGTIRLNSDKSSLQYKYVSNEDEYELFGADNRVLPLQGEKLDIDDIFNQYTALSKAKLTDLRFSEGAIREDIGILKKALKSIHPNLYRYISPPQLDSAFSALEQQLIVKNDLSSVYKYITLLLAR